MYVLLRSSIMGVNIKVKIWFFDVHLVMKLVVVTKMLQEALLASWNLSSAHWLHHLMNVKKANFYSYKVTKQIMFISNTNFCLFSQKKKQKNFFPIDPNGLADCFCEVKLISNCACMLETQ